MKSFSWWKVLAGGLWLGGALVWGQEGSSSAEFNAMRQDLDERLRRLESAVENLQAAQVAVQKKMSVVNEEFQRLREELARKPNEAVSHEELRSLEKKVQELNEKREADKRLILDKIEQLANMPPVLPAPTPSSKVTLPPPDPNQPGYKYEVQPNDTLSSIVSEFNGEFKRKGINGRITVAQVMSANQIKKATDLKVGQKLFIPEPARKP
jgi:LysM repeat protein